MVYPLVLLRSLLLDPGWTLVEFPHTYPEALYVAANESPFCLLNEECRYGSLLHSRNNLRRKISQGSPVHPCGGQIVPVVVYGEEMRWMQATFMAI
ncbi:hypothetical protein C8J56DRAFT_243292 [Mycena floridula]|nr:hypothetical protein C8J56DRAFT_243292 [Mycena floridula]